MSVEITLVFGIVSMVIAVVGFFVGQQTSAKKSGIEKGVIVTKIDNVLEQLHELKLEVKEANLQGMKTEITMLHEQVQKNTSDIRDIQKQR
jgi:hypothetical protein